MKHPIRAGLERASRRRGCARALTLLETLLTTIIVGVAITALVKQVFFTAQQNAWTQRVQVGTLLAENVREMMAGLPFSDPSNGTQTFGPEGGAGGERLATYNDVDDFDGFDSTVRPELGSGSPVGVVDAARRVITQAKAGGGGEEVPPEWRNWRQQIAVDPVDPMNLNVVYPKPQTARVCVRVTVTIGYRPAGMGAWQTVVQLRWLKTR